MTFLMTEDAQFIATSSTSLQDMFFLDVEEQTKESDSEAETDGSDSQNSEF